MVLLLGFSTPSRFESHYGDGFGCLVLSTNQRVSSDRQRCSSTARDIRWNGIEYIRTKWVFDYLRDTIRLRAPAKAGT